MYAFNSSDRTFPYGLCKQFLTGAEAHEYGKFNNSCSYALFGALPAPHCGRVSKSDSVPVRSSQACLRRGRQKERSAFIRKTAEYGSFTAAPYRAMLVSVLLARARSLFIRGSAHHHRISRTDVGVGVDAQPIRHAAGQPSIALGCQKFFT